MLLRARRRPACRGPAPPAARGSGPGPAARYAREAAHPRAYRLGAFGVATRRASRLTTVQGVHGRRCHSPGPHASASVLAAPSPAAATTCRSTGRRLSRLRRGRARGATFLSGRAGRGVRVHHLRQQRLAHARPARQRSAHGAPHRQPCLALAGRDHADEKLRSTGATVSACTCHRPLNRETPPDWHAALAVHG
jgi:hypothetical protein